ncbi:MAG: hypothetical protein IJZ23_04195 [Roseburia sp.]|nr:hypothetical protein [Roseburia sp.]
MNKKDERFTSEYSRGVVISFFALLVTLSVAAVLLPDVEVSKKERRRYATSPKLTWETVLNGSYMSDLEEYLLDQFAGREWFRTLKTEVETTLFGKSDANGYVRFKNGLYELDTEWNQSNVTRAAKELAALQEEMFSKANVYYALIPDKSYFLPKEEYPVADDAWIIGQMQEQLTEATYIDLYPYLTIEDYYRTDLHWKQEEILDVADAILTVMNEDYNPAAEDIYQIERITDAFYGGYAGGSAYDVAPDVLWAAKNDVTENATVYDYESKKSVSVYAPEKLEGTDPYDYYLWGARALLTIENPACDSGKKLLLFRDSFGSSMAPLLLEGYEEITLVDLRYISADYLKEMIDATEYDDVLFLYSQRVLRHSDSMKF